MRLQDANHLNAVILADLRQHFADARQVLGAVLVWRGIARTLHVVEHDPLDAVAPYDVADELVQVIHRLVLRIAEVQVAFAFADLLLVERNLLKE